VADSAKHYRELLASGVKYSQLDVRGNSSALLAADGTHGAPRQLHPVAAMLQARRAAGSQPGARTDGFKIALAVEGGGMRGCVAAGMVAAVHQLGLTDSLDAVYGSSAGSLIGAYLLSRQDPTYGCSIYYEELPKAGRSFIDMRNVLRSMGLGALRVTPAGVNDLMQRRLGMPVRPGFPCLLPFGFGFRHFPCPLLEASASSRSSHLSERRRLRPRFPPPPFLESSIELGTAYRSSLARAVPRAPLSPL